MITDISELSKEQSYMTERAGHWFRFYADKFPSVKIPKISLTFSNKMTQVAGSAEKINGIWYVTLGNRFIREKSFDQTVAHEFAHVFADEKFGTNCGHDSAWQYVMRLSGYPAERCHNYKTPPKRRHKTTQLYTCKICSQPISMGIEVRLRILEGYNYLCPRCKTRVVLD